MKRLFLLAFVALLLALQGPTHAQIHLPDASDRFAWKPPARQTANILSNVTLGGQVVWASVDSWRGAHRKRDFGRQACSFGVAQAFTLTSKATFSKLRPDGSDRKSFYSGHTASAASQSGYSYAIGIPLTIGTGVFRMGAAKHDLADISIGALVGFGAQALCHALID